MGDFSVDIKEVAATSIFGNIVLRGGPNEKILFSVFLGDLQIIDSEIYFFDRNGLITIQGIGKLLESYFICDMSCIMDSVKEFSFRFVGGITITKTVRLTYCTAIVSDLFDFSSLPLSRHAVKTTYRNTPEYISFISSYGKCVSLSVRIFKSGEFVVSDLTFSQFNDLGKIYHFDVSAKRVSDMMNNAGIYCDVESLCSWDVLIAGSSGKIRYNFVNKNQDSDSVFVYRNCFGGLESFVCTGVREQQFKSNREYGSINGRSVITSNDSELKYTINTGSIDSIKIASLIDLLSSEHVYVIRENNFIPILILSEDVKPEFILNKVQSAKFSYRLSENSIISPLTDSYRRIFDQTFDNTFN